jgi:hypothetical protein
MYENLHAEDMVGGTLSFDKKNDRLFAHLLDGRTALISADSDFNGVSYLTFEVWHTEL